MKDYYRNYALLTKILSKCYSFIYISDYYSKILVSNTFCLLVHKFIQLQTDLSLGHYSLCCFVSS